MTGLILLFVVAGSYLAAHVAFDWIARRYRIVSGAEYLVLGILLGPQVSGLLPHEAVQQFSPIVTLALGWAGAMLGSQLVLSAMIRVRAVVYRIALVESLLTLALVTALEVLVLSFTLGLRAQDALIPALALGAMATVSAEAGIKLVARGRGGDDPMVAQLRVSTLMNAVVAIVAFSFLIAMVHGPPAGAARAPTLTEWIVIDIAVGAVGGVLFHLFVGEERHPDRLFIALVGAVILVSGAAAYLQLSPLLSALAFGAILANTSLRRREIQSALQRVDRPLSFVMLMLAGAWWSPSERDWILPVVLFLTVRALGKIAGSRLASRANGRLSILGPDWGRGLLGQGSLALVIGLNYLQFPDLEAPNIVFTAVVASVLLTDFFSARLVEAARHTPPAVTGVP
jgi:Kef-type K+ transport system membrane component KefB